MYNQIVSIYNNIYLYINSLIFNYYLFMLKADNNNSIYSNDTIQQNMVSDNSTSSGSSISLIKKKSLKRSRSKYLL